MCVYVFLIVFMQHTQTKPNINLVKYLLKKGIEVKVSKFRVS